MRELFNSHTAILNESHALKAKVRIAPWGGGDLLAQSPRCCKQRRATTTYRLPVPRKVQETRDASRGLSFELLNAREEAESLRKQIAPDPRALKDELQALHARLPSQAESRGVRFRYSVTSSAGAARRRRPREGGARVSNELIILESVFIV